ncbi:MAG TPA: sugar ABC transporter permease [Fimbriimonadaceae bacterium]|nr:ABC transporter permease [Armatimonadota bacterium]HCM74178.1 ABC transporter permease [Armatimonadota bacterium]HRD30211.1 sugar ABC transporter permease [Fimbriimonadaceae bacterium]HRE94498.1 sugar ABC transporter permease [Fimbriimonadaceae bacterium]HRI74184.1 sugar ABC transporter permease [Fimbriimonadaceae bacterium]
MRKSQTGWWFIAPATLHLLVFAFVPVAYAAYVSLFRWDILRDERTFVGLDQYQRLMADQAFWGSMGQTFKYALMAVPGGLVAALLVALAVSQPLKGMAWFRTLFYIPAVSSGVAIAMLWIYVYLPERGLINTMLMGLGQPSIDFLNESGWALPALAFMSVWVGLGPRMIIYVAGLMSLPVTVYEAASLDGASGWQKFWRMTMPLLAPTHLFVLVTSTIGAFQTFTPVYMMTNGRPMGSTNLVGYHIYVTAWENFNVSAASAQSFVLLFLLGLVSLAQFRMMRRRLEGYDAS